MIRTRGKRELRLIVHEVLGFCTENSSRLKLLGYKLKELKEIDDGCWLLVDDRLITWRRTNIPLKKYLYLIESLQLLLLLLLLLLAAKLVENY